MWSSRRIGLIIRKTTCSVLQRNSERSKGMHDTRLKSGLYSWREVRARVPAIGAIMHMDVCHTHVVYINIYVYGPQPHGHQLDNDIVKTANMY